MKEVSYYPGALCTGRQRSTTNRSKGSWVSSRSASTNLQNWTCCGASSAHCTDETLAVTLAARNLAIAEKATANCWSPALPVTIGSKWWRKRRRIIQGL